MGLATWFAFLVCGQFYPELVEAQAGEDHLTGSHAHLYRRPLEENSVTCVGKEFDSESIRPIFDKYRNDYNGHYYLKRLNVTDKWSGPKEMSEFAKVIYEPVFLDQVPGIKQSFESCVLEYKNTPPASNVSPHSKRFWECIDPKNVKDTGEKFCKDLGHGIARRLDKWGKCVKVVPKLKEKAVKCVGDKLDIQSATKFIANEPLLGKTSPQNFLGNLNLTTDYNNSVPLKQNLEDFMWVLFDPALLQNSSDIKEKYMECVDILIPGDEIRIEPGQRATAFVECIAPKTFLSEGQKICSLNSPTTPSSNPFLDRLREAYGPSAKWGFIQRQIKQPDLNYSFLLTMLQLNDLDLEEFFRKNIDASVNWKDLLDQPGGEDVARVILLEQANGKVDWIAFFKNLPRPFQFNRIFPEGVKPHESWPERARGLPTWSKIVPGGEGGLFWQYMFEEAQQTNPDWPKILNSSESINTDPAQLLNKYIRYYDWEEQLSTPEGRKAAWLMLLLQATGKFDFRKAVKNSWVEEDIPGWLQNGLGPNVDLNELLPGSKARMDWPKFLSENGGQGVDWPQLIQLGKGPNPNWEDMVDQIGENTNLDFKAVGEHTSLNGGNLEGMLSQPGGKQVALLLVLQEACGITGDAKIAVTIDANGNVFNVVYKQGRDPVTLRVPAS